MDLSKSGEKMSKNSIIPNLDKFFELDPHIKFFKNDLESRYQLFSSWLNEIESSDGGIESFTTSFRDYGIHCDTNGVIKCKEWIPDVESVSLVGDFNHWKPDEHLFQHIGFGIWELQILPINKGVPVVPHLSKIKLRIRCSDGRVLFRLSPWTVYAIQNDHNKLFESCLWNPPDKYVWKHPWPLKEEYPSDGLRIYEAHIGIASENYFVASYKDFKTTVLPHIKYLEYNTIQLMAIMEHAFYASFGYQVTSFFAVSSRYGTPDELKELIDECHSLGFRVLLDVIHSHACKNTEDGLNQFNGTNHCFFHDNYRGYHDQWDSRLFDMSKFEVKKFLLSNLRWYVEEYHFDGFRFDGVTSMLYHHHGNLVDFSGDYKEYFGIHVDVESVAYLQLANHMLHQLYPNIITIAEEVSGLPGLCRPIDEGGLGFDYRLAMAIPDKWIKMLKEQRDEDWNMWDIVWTLINRRHGEKHVAYAESHDQALVGDKTLAFWLMDSEMYWNMSVVSGDRNLTIDRGIALHKMIRLITMALGGEAYLTFMGNEFGHPEWLDFPRPGNENSYHYARRQWNLVHREDLRYRFLSEFDRHMQMLERKYGWLKSPQAFVSKHHESDKIIVFERGSLLWVFNFHPANSFVDYRVPLSQPKNQKIVLCSDSKIFDGHDRVDTSLTYFFENYSYFDQPNSLRIYIPSRVALVFAPIDSE